MILLAAEGLSTDEIAARLDVRREIVWKWRKRFFEQRLPGLDEQPRPGRPRVFPRDPFFAAKASRILDLYERVFEGEPLKDDEFVLSTDEKTSIQARARRHPTLPPKPGQPMRVEHEYRGCGAGAA